MVGELPVQTGHIRDFKQYIMPVLAKNHNNPELQKS